MSYVIEMLDITKTFPGIIANDHINLQVEEGEIHALLGENGAGKSTLMSVLFGLYKPDSGKIKIKGKEVHIEGPLDANHLGIGMVHQHFKLIHNFTVLQNIILGVETVNNGFLKMNESREKVRFLSERYGLKVDPDALISEITVGMQQRVEILKMLYRENNILILDEPTAVLTPQEIDELMLIMQTLAKEGKSIIFITHKLAEIKAVAHRCSVLRRGKYVGTVDVASTTKEVLSEMMVGHKVNLAIEKGSCQPKEALLQVTDLCVASRREGHLRNIVNHVSFSVHSGEIICIAGIDGNGQTELIQAITGLIPLTSGMIQLKGEDITNKTVRYKNTHGLGHIPEDRHRYGLVLDYTLEDNLALQEYFHPPYERYGFLNRQAIKDHAEHLIQAFDIRSGQGATTLARSLSGGNQQKAIIAREIARNPDLLIAVQPTRGLDVGAMSFIHQQLIKEREKGHGILLVSLELDEVMNLSDRILVMYEGEIVASLNPEQTTTSELGLYMAGSKRRSAL